MLSSDSPAPQDTAPQLELPWPSLCQGRRLLILAATQGGRGRSLGRFLGAAFITFGLLLLLAGSQKALPPAQAGGGACIFAGLGLLAAVRRGAAPLLILDGASGAAILCRRRLGRRAFRIFPLDAVDVSVSPDGRLLCIRPQGKDGAGREIPGLASRISDRGWQQGMALPVPPGGAQEALGALRHCLHLVSQGEAPVIQDACDGAEFSALLGKPLPGTLLQFLSGETWPELRNRATGQPRDSEQEAALRESPVPRPEIRRAPDLRESSGRRDKRD